jgi:hypothetical protein
VGSLALEWTKWRTSSPAYYVSLVRYSIPVDTQRLKFIISKQTSSKQHYTYEFRSEAARAGKNGHLAFILLKIRGAVTRQLEGLPS